MARQPKEVFPRRQDKKTPKETKKYARKRNMSL